MIPATPCPDEHAFMELAAGQLDEAAMAAMEAHIDGCAACAELFIALGQLVEPDAALTPADPPATRRMIGRYQLQSILGSGGMGVVWEAYDPQLARRVAIKLLRPELGDQARRQARLLQEARALAALSHPNILAVFDAGEQDGQVWLAMELVRGVGLGVWARQHQRDWRRVLAATLDAATGLAAAHRAGITHRDVKPDNILVREDGRAVLTDFGLASAPAWQDGSTSEPDRLTATGAVMGTPLYMAPEVLAGAGADAMSDQYALCATLYEALYGARPYSAQTLDELTRQATAGVLTRPRSRDIPPALFLVLQRGLSPRPAERYPDIDALLKALHRAAAPARLPALLLGAALVTSIAGAAWWATRAPEQPSPAPAPVIAQAPAPTPPVVAPDLTPAITHAAARLHDALASAPRQGELVNAPPKRRDATPRKAVSPPTAPPVGPPAAVQHDARFPESERLKAQALTESLRTRWLSACSFSLQPYVACLDAERALARAMGGARPVDYLNKLAAQGANPESVRITGSMLSAFFLGAGKRAGDEGRCDEGLALHMEHLALWADANPANAHAQRVAADTATQRILFAKHHPACK
jgi:predicted Ser/Thr protein kinase